MADVLTKAAGEAETAERVRPKIEINSVTLQSSGFAWNSYMVRMPDGSIFADLVEPSIWSKVQGSRHSLKKLDRLAIVAYDESWLADCIVGAATNAIVTLSRPVKHDLPTRSAQLMEDELYRVAWVGNGYVTIRKKDGMRMTDPVVSVFEAERRLSALYSRPAA